MSARGKSRILLRLVWWGCVVALGLSVSWWLPSSAPEGGGIVLVAYPADEGVDCSQVPPPEDPSVDDGIPDEWCSQELSGVEGWIAARLGATVASLTGYLSAETLQLRPESLHLMDPGDPSGFYGLSFGIARASVILLITVGGLWLMSQETLQSRFTLKDLAPRVLLGVVGMELSVRILAWAIAHANALTGAILSLGLSGVPEKSVGETLLETLKSEYRGQSWMVITLLVAIIVMLTCLVLGVVFRSLLLTLLAVLAPVALASYMLPFTSGLARLWWRALGACVASAVGQALVLVLWFNLFFTSENRREAIIPTPHNAAGAYIEMATILVLLWLMHKALSIPMKRALAPVGGNPLGPVGQFLRGLIVAKTFGLAGGLHPARTTPGEAPVEKPAASKDEPAKPSHPEWPAVRFVPVEDLHGAVTPRRRLAPDEYRPRKPFLSPAPPLPPEAGRTS